MKVHDGGFVWGTPTSQYDQMYFFGIYGIHFYHFQNKT